MRLTFLLCLAFVLTLSCDTQTPPCLPENCDGCCGEGGQCFTGNSSLACGTGGEMCQTCVAPAHCSIAGACTTDQSGGNVPTGPVVPIQTAGGGAGGGTGSDTGGGQGTGGGIAAGGGIGGGVGGGLGGGGTGGGFGGGLGGGFGGGGVGGGLGGGGTNFCNTTNCLGCCLGSTCINLPNNLSDVTCGVSGIACSDCTTMGARCDPSAGICRFAEGQ